MTVFKRTTSPSKLLYLLLSVFVFSFCFVLFCFWPCVRGTFADDATHDGDLPMKHASDEIVSSAECSSDDEDLEECDTSHAGGLGWFAFACFHCASTHLTWRIEASSRHHSPMTRPIKWMDRWMQIQIGIKLCFVAPYQMGYFAILLQVESRVAYICTWVSF